MVSKETLNFKKKCMNNFFFPVCKTHMNIILHQITNFRYFYQWKFIGFRHYRSSNNVSIRGNNPLLKSVPSTCFKATRSSYHAKIFHKSYIKGERQIEEYTERHTVLTFRIETESEQVTSRFTMLLHILSSCGLIQSAKLFNR